MIEAKIQNAICKEIEPLYDIWKKEAKWTDEEAIVMFHKLFDSDKPDDLTILDILADNLGKEYLYYHKRKVNRIYRSARKKLNKILP